ncbi:hypothetical protein RclHR1_09210012 [Rhizophagus clarus]|uniref:DUF6826 domain-containing protein n=1 Tax=Rhizophagus clarus TaxID=94130 RepID=A0A2Z6S9T0_9GLOM|nr:hypothetical protein RclHR1_09210012 [Rhizophagus clarus]
MSDIFIYINNLPFDTKEKAEILCFFTYGDAADTAKVETVLSTIKDDEVKVEYLRKCEYMEEKRKRRDMELEYEKEKNKRFRFQTLLDATTHSLSRLWEVYNPTRVEVLWFEPSKRSLLFDTPPTNDRESSYQNYFIKRILSQLDINNCVMAVDTRGTKFLDGKAPDICTHSKGYSLTSHTVEVIGEIKPLGSCFTPTHKGQVLQYAVIALKHQKNLRKEITGFLTDCHDIMFIRICKGSEDSDTPYKISFSDQMSLSNQITTKYLRALLSTIYCHPMLGLAVQLDDLIASTSNSAIFGIINDTNSVVKVVRNNYFLENEIKILNELQMRQVIDEGIIKLINSSNTAMLLRPRATKSFKESQEPVSRLGDIVDKLRICHQNNLVHGDVRLSNILVYNDRLILADFGCALHEGKNWNGCGPTLPFRSLRLMEAIKVKEPTVKCQDDLFTFVQSIYIRLNEEQVIEADINSPNKVDEAIKFWQKVFEEGIWRNMYIFCNNLDYDNLKRYINELA